MNKSKLFKLLKLSLMICLLAVLCCFAVLADAIWEPFDSFYRDHNKECVYVNRSFTASGADGTVTVWKSPVSDIKIATVRNNNTFNVSFTYKDSNGAEWGVVAFTVDESGNTKNSYKAGDKTGWILMKDLTVIYDNTSFCDDHKSEFKSYQGELDSYVIKNEIVVWTYPGSGHTCGAIKTLGQDKLQITDVYTDKNGNAWGYEPYFRGIRGWICISTPEESDPLAIGTSKTGKDIPSQNVTTKNKPLTTETNLSKEGIATSATAELSLESTDSAIDEDIIESIVPAEPSNIAAGPTSPMIIILAVVLTASAVAATVLLIHIFWKKKNNSAK